MRKKLWKMGHFYIPFWSYWISLPGRLTRKIDCQSDRWLNHSYGETKHFGYSVTISLKLCNGHSWLFWHTKRKAHPEVFPITYFWVFAITAFVNYWWPWSHFQVDLGLGMHFHWQPDRGSPLVGVKEQWCDWCKHKLSFAWVLGYDCS